MAFLMRILLIPALILMSFPLCAAALPAERATDIQDIEAATDAWRAAYDSRDPNTIVSRYAPDAVFWGTTARTIASTQLEVAHYFSNAAKRPNARVTIGEQHVRIYGDIATNAEMSQWDSPHVGNHICRLLLTPHRLQPAYQLLV